ncbi:hypothetical protein FALBO_4129 [Fusarium albosuccineum]|uniref:Heme oxygenase n=1 Tax=Fusarium albosuccineum TaxID=1237068 RepID=A0A8H4PGM6_9HYPO|nr:hypothetical protein FALBO_4129 [Fusarium albosuccineum]
MASTQAEVFQESQPQLPHHLHDRPLAESIATATRSIHAKLNKLIIARLPLALPPLAADPGLYISGLLHVAPIYITFEALWRDILDSIPAADADKKESDACGLETVVPDSEEAASPVSDAQKPPSDSRMQSLLQTLFLPGLMRSDRLKADIANLTGWSDSIVEEQLQFIEQNGRLGAFIQHIKRSTQHRPHVLLAYSYILFMALFAGGRFIRATLESAGDEFWDHLPAPIKPTSLPCQQCSRPTKRASGLSDEEVPTDDYPSHATHTMPLRFFHFKTSEDGEDLKREFKRRLADMEELLTAREKHDIIQESVCIFENMTLLVHQLDSVCGDSDWKDSSSTPASLYELVDHFHPFRSRLRDSVSIAKERSAKSLRFSSNGVRQAWNKWMNRATNSPLEPQTKVDIPSGHPAVSKTNGGIELCPAFSKSMRFENVLPQPTHIPNKAEHDFNECFESASQRLRSAHVVTWLIMMAFGSFVFGAFLSARRGVEI